MATFNTFFFDIRDLLQDSWTQNAFDFLKGDQAQNDLGFMVDQAKWVCKSGYLLNRQMGKNLYFTKTNFLLVTPCLKITQNVSFIFAFLHFPRIFVQLKKIKSKVNVARFARNDE